MAPPQHNRKNSKSGQVRLGTGKMNRSPFNNRKNKSPKQLNMLMKTLTSNPLKLKVETKSSENGEGDNNDDSNTKQSNGGNNLRSKRSKERNNKNEEPIITKRVADSKQHKPNNKRVRLEKTSELLLETCSNEQDTENKSGNNCKDTTSENNNASSHMNKQTQRKELENDDLLNGKRKHSDSPTVFTTKRKQARKTKTLFNKTSMLLDEENVETVEKPRRTRSKANGSSQSNRATRSNATNKKQEANGTMNENQVENGVEKCTKALECTTMEHSNADMSKDETIEPLILNVKDDSKTNESADVITEKIGTKMGDVKEYKPDMKEKVTLDKQSTKKENKAIAKQKIGKGKSYEKTGEKQKALECYKVAAELLLPDISKKLNARIKELDAEIGEREQVSLLQISSEVQHSTTLQNADSCPRKVPPLQHRSQPEPASPIEVQSELTSTSPIKSNPEAKSTHSSQSEPQSTSPTKLLAESLQHTKVTEIVTPTNASTTMKDRLPMNVNCVEAICDQISKVELDQNKNEKLWDAFKSFVAIFDEMEKLLQFKPIDDDKENQDTSVTKKVSFCTYDTTVVDSPVHGEEGSEVKMENLIDLICKALSVESNIIKLKKRFDLNEEANSFFELIRNDSKLVKHHEKVLDFLRFALTSSFSETTELSYLKKRLHELLDSMMRYLLRRAFNEPLGPRNSTPIDFEAEQQTTITVGEEQLMEEEDNEKYVDAVISKVQTQLSAAGDPSTEQPDDDSDWNEAGEIQSQCSEEDDYDVPNRLIIQQHSGSCVYNCDDLASLVHRALRCLYMLKPVAQSLMYGDSIDDIDIHDLELKSEGSIHILSNSFTLSDLLHLFFESYEFLCSVFIGNSTLGAMIERDQDCWKKIQKFTTIVRQFKVEPLKALSPLGNLAFFESELNDMKSLAAMVKEAQESLERKNKATEKPNKVMWKYPRILSSDDVISGKESASRLCVCPECDKPVEEENEGGEIVCDNCMQWIHKRCLGLPEEFTSAQFICEKCMELSNDAEEESEEEDSDAEMNDF